MDAIGPLDFVNIWIKMHAFWCWGWVKKKSSYLQLRDTMRKIKWETVWKRIITWWRFKHTEFRNIEKKMYAYFTNKMFPYCL